jgi:excisionase family DNA binding protein
MKGTTDVTVTGDLRGRMTIPEICDRLKLGKVLVYRMLEQGQIPALRVGRKWIVTKFAYDQWERTAGSQPAV